MTELDSSDETIDSRDRATLPPAEDLHALLAEVQAAITRSNELMIRLLNRLNITDLSVLTVEAHGHNRDMRLDDHERRLLALEQAAGGRPTPATEPAGPLGPA